MSGTGGLGAAGWMRSGGLTPSQRAIKRAEPARLKPQGNATLARPCLIYQENWIFVQNVLSFKYRQPSQHFKNYYASQIGVSSFQLLVIGALYTNVSGSSWTAEWLTMLSHLLAEQSGSNA